MFSSTFYKHCFTLYFPFTNTTFILVCLELQGSSCNTDFRCILSTVSCKTDMFSTKVTSTDVRSSHTESQYLWLSKWELRSTPVDFSHLEVEVFEYLLQMECTILLLCGLGTTGVLPEWAGGCCWGDGCLSVTPYGIKNKMYLNSLFHVQSEFPSWKNEMERRPKFDFPLRKLETFFLLIRLWLSIKPLVVT